MKEYRVVEIAEDARTLASDRGFLLVKEKGEEIGRIELDSVSAVICNANWTMLGTPIISKLAEYNIPLVVCDKRTKVPKCALISLDANWRQGKVLEAQARCSIPKNKSAWQSIISAKLEQQGNPQPARLAYSTLQYCRNQRTSVNPQPIIIIKSRPSHCRNQRTSVNPQQVFNRCLAEIHCRNQRTSVNPQQKSSQS